MATKRESELSSKFVTELRKDCSDRGDRIKIIKIHGGPFQTLGVSDYLGWYKGIGFGLEFKVDSNTLTEAQEQFLTDIIGTGNVGIVVTFRRGLTRNKLYGILNAAYLEGFRGMIYRTNVGY